MSSRTARARGLGCTVLGAAARAGKSAVAIGMMRSLRVRGVTVAPFKAITVVRHVDPAHDGLPLWQRGIFHSAAAAGQKVDWWHNPVTVVTPEPDANEGELYICTRRSGTVPVGGEDTLDLARLSPRVRRECTAAVWAGWDRTRSNGHRIVMEGAGGAADLNPATDLANALAPARAALPVILVANVRRSGHLAALVGTARMLPRRLAPLLAGYVLNQVTDASAVAGIRAWLEPALRLPLLAALPESARPDDYDGSTAMREWIYDRWADNVTEHGLLDALGLSDKVDDHDGR